MVIATTAIAVHVPGVIPVKPCNQGRRSDVSDMGRRAPYGGRGSNPRVAARCVLVSTW